MAAHTHHQRVKRGTLTREHVIDAAERLIHSGADGSLSMRSLAADLGVAPMSLYAHVRDKDDLLDEVVDRLLAQYWRPDSARDDWMAWVSEAAERLRALLIAEPVALHVYLAHPVVSPSALARMEEMLDVLKASGFASDAAEDAYAALHTYTIGFAALEASRSRNPRSGDVVNPLVERLARFTTTEQFREGLKALLAGLASHH